MPEMLWLLSLVCNNFLLYPCNYFSNCNLFEIILSFGQKKYCEGDTLGGCVMMTMTSSSYYFFQNFYKANNQSILKFYNSIVVQYSIVIVIVVIVSYMIV